MGSTENLEKGLRRGDAEVALQGLLRVPDSERGPFVEPVGALLRAAVQKAHQAKDWSKLMSWASRAEKLAALAGAPGTAEHQATCWAFTWAAIKTKEWERALRWFEPLGPLLAARSPSFAAAMASLAAGKAVPEQLAPFCKAAEAADARLGHDLKRTRAEWAVPASPSAAEQSLLAMVSREPWSVFAANVAQWATKVDETTRRLLWELAGALACREALRRARTGAPLGEPVELLRLAVEGSGASEVLAGEAVLMLRLVGTHTADEVGELARARVLAAAAKSVSAYPAHRLMAVAAVTQRTYSPEAASPIIKVLEHLAAQQLDVEVVGKAMLLLANFGPARGTEARPSPELVRGLSAVIDADAEGLGRWLEVVEASRRENLTGWMGFVLPVEVIQKLICAVWPAVPAARQTLLQMIDDVLLRLYANIDPFSVDQDPLDLPLARAARPFWKAVRGLVMSQDPEYFGFGLREAVDDADRREVIGQALAGKPDIELLLSAWKALRDNDRPVDLIEQVEEAVFRRYGEDQHALIHGVLEAQSLGLPIVLKRRLAEALRSQAHTPCHCERREDALVLMTRWLKSTGAKKKSDKTQSDKTQSDKTQPAKKPRARKSKPAPTDDPKPT